MCIHKYGVLIYVCLLTGLMGYLAMRSIHLEGASLKTCVLMLVPLLIWLAYLKVSAFAEKYATKMKKTIIFFVATAGCLFFSSLTFPSFERPERVKFEKDPLSPSQIVAEQIATNGFLRQILVEVIKPNTVKSDNRCNDGEKNYYPGYIISVDKKTLRCDIDNSYPE